MNIKINDWLKDDIWGYWQVVAVTPQGIILKNAFDREMRFRSYLHIENDFRYEYADEGKFEPVTSTERGAIEAYFREHPEDSQTFSRFTEKYLTYREQIVHSDLSEADWRIGHYFRRTTERTAFFVNVSDFGEYLGIIYGYVSTAYMSGEEQWFDRHGASENTANLRFGIRIWNESDEALARDAIEAVFRTYCDTAKDALLDIVKLRRKAFLQRIHDMLKPLGFRKKGSKWHKSLTDTHVLEFYAQKSTFTDEFYFNISVMQTEHPGLPCYFTRIRQNGSDMFDWQLLSDQEMDDLLHFRLETVILPIMHTPLNDLGKNPDIWKGCYCKRDKCTSCWVEKNPREAKEILPQS